MLRARFLVAPLLLGLATVVALSCSRDPIRDLEVRRVQYSATLTGFLVKDEPGKEHPDILLDVTLEGDAQPPLPGLTLDVSMADAKGKEKAHRRVWIDGKDLGPGGVQQTLTLKDLPYQPGDGFWVGVRSPVPAAERAQYREFEATEK